MKTAFTIEGAAELERNLATLGRRVQQRVVRTAVRAAQRPVHAAARANATAAVGGTMGGLLARALVLRVRRRNRPGTYAMDVRLRSESEGAPPEFMHVTKAGRRYWVPAAIEYGHGADREGAARPFMRPAADRTIEEAKRILTRELASGILREAIKARYAGP